VAEVSGEVAGWFGFEPFREWPAYHATAEVSVYAAEGYRRRGIGRLLLADASRHAPALGPKTPTASAFGRNGASLAPFESFGFERRMLYPRVAKLDGAERDLAVLGLRLDKERGEA
jgi:phosphinothricin acetyltransferase